MRNHKRSTNGQVYIEVLCGIMILIPIALFGLDLIVLVLANSANDSLAKDCARAAANAQGSGGALTAAKQIVDQFPASPLIEKVILDDSKLSFNTSAGAVVVETEMTVRIPVTLPGTISSMKFRARASEPVVGICVAPDSPTI